MTPVLDDFARLKGLIHDVLGGAEGVWWNREMDEVELSAADADRVMYRFQKWLFRETEEVRWYLDVTVHRLSPDTVMRLYWNLKGTEPVTELAWLFHFMVSSRAARAKAAQFSHAAFNRGRTYDEYGAEAIEAGAKAGEEAVKQYWKKSAFMLWELAKERAL